jgi:hypothetical protein
VGSRRSSLARVVIVGAGGHGREVADIVEAVNGDTPTFELLGVVDDDPRDRPELDRRGLALLGPLSRLPELDAAYVIGMGSGRARAEVDEWATAAGVEPLPELVHPDASRGSDLQLGP